MFGHDRYDKMKGKRVLAIHTINNDFRFIEVFGRGVFVGVEQVDELALGNTADEVRATGELNPKMELDDGEIIWGCECWWMDAYKGDMWLSEMASHGYQVRDVSIADLRAGYRKEANDGKE